MKLQKKNDIARTRITTLTCPSCEDEIFSRANHDFRTCKCGEIFVDGGFEYLRFGFAKKMPKKRIRYIKVSKNELYQDWNKNCDKFGKIEG